MKIQIQPEIKQEPDVILTKESLVFIRTWIDENESSLPDAIRPFFFAMLDMCEDAQVLLKNNKKLVELLRQHMGFVPTKERNGKSDQIQGSEELWTKDGENSLKVKANKALEIWKEYKNNRPKNKTNSTIKKDESIIEAESKELESTATVTTEAMFQLPAAQIANKIEECLVDRKNLPNGLGTLSSSYKERTRYDVSLLLTTINYKVETVQSPETGFSKTATVDDGPARFRITWNGMAQVVLLVVGMSIPMVRLASCLGVTAKYFCPSRIYRFCLYAAHACFAIYLEIFRQLALCNILAGDDTNNSVLEMRKDNPSLSKEEINRQNTLLKSSKAKTNPQEIDLLLEAEEFLGTQLPTKNGKGLKKSIFTTVVIGQRLDLGKTATLVFYHSERKSFGDVIGKVLALREKNPEICLKPLVIQSDLSSSNNPNPLPPNLPLTFVGCAAHARRPFWRFRNDADPLVVFHCYTMLLSFEKIFDSDRDARATGKNEKILQARRKEQQPLWLEILKQAESVVADFAPNSDLGKAGAYIVNNFGKLTHYLSDPNLKPDNNWAERLLRYEKVMLDNSKFRVSKRGRLIYDILRTILATCNAASVTPFDYLIYIFKNQVDARKNPAQYTPHAYAIKSK